MIVSDDPKSQMSETNEVNLSQQRMASINETEPIKSQTFLSTTMPDINWVREQQAMWGSKSDSQTIQTSSASTSVNIIIAGLEEDREDNEDETDEEEVEMMLKLNFARPKREVIGAHFGQVQSRTKIYSIHGELLYR